MFTSDAYHSQKCLLGPGHSSDSIISWKLTDNAAACEAAVQKFMRVWLSGCSAVMCQP